jgi:hypothetical protein
MIYDHLDAGAHLRGFLPSSQCVAKNEKVEL